MSKARKVFRKFPKMCKTWLINVSEELYARNARLDTGTSLKRISRVVASSEILGEPYVTESDTNSM